jgi:transcriptional regulator with XRE-family HTH domain
MRERKEEYFKKIRSREEPESAAFRLKLSASIKDIRQKKRLTQAKLAQKAGMPQSVIARVENGERGMTITTLIRIANALGKEIKFV